MFHNGTPRSNYFKFEGSGLVIIFDSFYRSMSWVNLSLNWIIYSIPLWCNRSLNSEIRNCILFSLHGIYDFVPDDDPSKSMIYFYCLEFYYRFVMFRISVVSIPDMKIRFRFGYEQEIYCDWGIFCFEAFAQELIFFFQKWEFIRIRKR